MSPVRKTEESCWVNNIVSLHRMLDFEMESRMRFEITDGTAV